MAYCTPADINLGSMDLPRAVDVQEVIDVQAGWIDAILGQRYRLPLALDGADPTQAAMVLFLNKLNVYAVKGTIILEVAGPREDNALSSWARYYLKWVEAQMTRFSNGSLDIPGQMPAHESTDDGSNAPMILNKDTFNRVDAFYEVGQRIPPWQGTREEDTPWV